MKQSDADYMFNSPRACFCLSASNKCNSVTIESIINIIVYIRKGRNEREGR
jgi:hypothetical protein